MATIRHSEQALNEKRESISKLKAEIRHLEETAKGKDLPFWKERMAPMLRVNIETNQQKINKLLDAPTDNAADTLADLKALRGSIWAWERELGTVDGAEQAIAAKRERIVALAAELDQIEKEQGI